MAITFYLGRTEAEWKQLLGELKAEELALIRGDRFLAVSTGGKSFTRRVRSSDEIKRDLYEAVSALQVIDPTTYGSPATKTYADCSSFQYK